MPRVDKVKPVAISRFLANTADVSKKTTLNYHTALSSLWAYLVKIGHAKENVVCKVDPPRPEEKQVVPFTRDEIASLLNVIRDKKSEVRNRAIILLLLDTGLRSSELCALRAKDIDLVKHKVRTMGKGDKERYIPFSSSTAEAIEKYFKQRGLTSYKGRLV